MINVLPAFKKHPAKTYNDKAVAVRAFEQICMRVGIDEMKYVVCTDDDGRFYVVALPKAEHSQALIKLAECGVQAIRT